MLTTARYDSFTGIDIAAVTFTTSSTTGTTPPSRAVTLTQTPEGYAALIQRLQATGSAPERTLVVMEATGSYWITLATTLHAAGFAISVINPAQAHYFAKALLKRTKTDAIDAQTLARLAAVLQPEPWTPPPDVYYELQQRLVQRDALIQMRQQVRNQLHALIQGPVVVAAVRERMETLIAALTGQIAAVKAELEPTLAMDEAWAAAAERLQSIPGIGLVTAGWLLATTLNFSVCASAEEATAYAGLAPTKYLSGTSVRGQERIGHSGNGRLRTALYMATLRAAQSNPAIKTFYDRLVAAGKLKKVARCAAARKLLHQAFAVVTKERMFDPDYHHHQTPRLNIAA